MPQIKIFDSIIIGAGHSGLVTSFYLKSQGINHCILEKEDVASSWATKTWDSFKLVTPNWMNQLPGLPYTDVSKDAFLSKAQYIEYLESYQKILALPIIRNVEVTLVEFDYNRDCFILTTNTGDFYAKNVVVATSSFNDPSVPSISTKVSPGIKQLHSSQYQNPRQFSTGSVLVVGSGQSGVQISEELLNAGKKVYLAVSKVGRVPRSYRNKDITEWIYTMQEYENITPTLDEFKGKFPNNPNISKVDGDVSFDLYDLVHRGLFLLGSIVDAQDTKMQLRDNIGECLEYSDQTLQEIKTKIDNFMGASNDTKPKNPNPSLGLQPSEIDLNELDIQSIVWATGFRFDFRYINIPIFDQYGFPITDNGVTKFPGLYFVGLKGSYKLKTGLIFGTQEQAQHVANHINANCIDHKVAVNKKLKARL